MLVRNLPPSRFKKTVLVFRALPGSSTQDQGVKITVETFERMHATFAKKWDLYCKPLFGTNDEVTQGDDLPAVTFGWDVTHRSPSKIVQEKCEAWAKGVVLAGSQAQYIMTALKTAAESLWRMWFLP